MDQVLPGYPEEYRYLHSEEAPTMINLHKDRPSPTTTIESRGNHGNKHEAVPFTEDLENVSLYYGTNNKSNSNNNNSNTNNNSNNKNNNKNNSDSVTISTASDLEEGARRKLRRERNKVAASKCRNKRKEHIRYLMKESDDLETKNSLLQKEVFLLQSEIKELECMLDTHRCIMKAEINR